MGDKGMTVQRRHKFGAKPCVIQGIRFASQKEGARYLELKTLERGGYILGLELQPSFDLRSENGQKVGAYRADFAYHEKVRGGTQWVIEDVKGFKTPLYRWKKKHVEAQYGIQIRET